MLHFGIEGAEKKEPEEKKESAKRAEIEEIARKGLALSLEGSEKREGIQEKRAAKRKERGEEEDQLGGDKKLKSMSNLLSLGRQGSSQGKRKLEKEPEESFLSAPTPQKKRKTEEAFKLDRELEQLLSQLDRIEGDRLQDACRRFVQLVALHVSQASGEKKGLEWEKISRALKEAEGVLRRKGLSFFDEGSEVSFPCFYLGEEGSSKPVGVSLNPLKAFLVAPSLLKSALRFPVGQPFEKGSFLFDFAGLGKKAPLYIQALIFLVEHRRKKLLKILPSLDLEEFFRFCQSFQSPLLQRRFLEELSPKGPSADGKLNGSEEKGEKKSLHKEACLLMQALTKWERGEASEAQLLQASERFVLLVCRTNFEENCLETDQKNHLESPLEALKRLAFFMQRHPGFAKDSFLRLSCSYHMEGCKEQLFDFEPAVPRLLLHSRFFDKLLRNLPEGELSKHPHLDLEGSSLKELVQSRRFLLGIEEESRRQELLERGEGALDSLTTEERGQLKALKRAEYRQLERLLLEVGGAIDDPKSLDKQSIEDLCALYELSEYYEAPELSAKIFRSLSKREGSVWEEVKRLLEALFAHPGSDRNALMLLSENFQTTGLRLFKGQDLAWSGVELGYFTARSQPMETFRFLKEKGKLSLLEELFKEGEKVSLEIFSDLPLESQRLFWEKISKNRNLRELSISPSEVVVEGEHPQNLERLEWLINGPIESGAYDRILKKRERALLRLFSSLPLESQPLFWEKIGNGEKLSFPSSQTLSEGEGPESPEKLKELFESLVKKGVYHQVAWEGWLANGGEVSCLLGRRDSIKLSNSPQLEQVSRFLGVSSRGCSIVHGKEFFKALIREADLYRSISGRETLSSCDLSRVRREIGRIRPLKVKHLVIADYESNWLRLIPYYLEMQAIETFSIDKRGTPFSSRGFVDFRDKMPHLKKLFLSGVKMHAHAFTSSRFDELEELDLSGVEGKWGQYGVLEVVGVGWTKKSRG